MPNVDCLGTKYRNCAHDMGTALKYQLHNSVMYALGYKVASLHYIEGIAADTVK